MKSQVKKTKRLVEKYKIGFYFLPDLEENRNKAKHFFFRSKLCLLCI